MKIEIAFSGEGSRRPRCGYRLTRVQPGPSVQFVCTSPGPTVIHYHWHEKVPFIHTVPVCICSTMILPKRERAYLGGLLAVRNSEGEWAWEPTVIELSSRALYDIDVITREHRHIRGAKLSFKRNESKVNSVLSVTLHSFQPEEKLPPCLDVMSFVHELWAEYLPPVARPSVHSVDDRVPWDEANPEIPC